MNSFTSKVVGIAVGLMMIAGVSFALTNEVGDATVTRNTYQNQTDFNRVGYHSGFSTGGGIQRGNIKGESHGTGYGTGHTYDVQEQGYYELRGDNVNGTMHEGSSRMTSTRDLAVGPDGTCGAKVRSKQSQDSITTTGNHGPSNMTSGMNQDTKQRTTFEANGRNTEVTADLYSKQNDSYAQSATRSDENGWTDHSGEATQEATLNGGAGGLGRGLGWNKASQSGTTHTEYSTGAVNTMSSRQVATSTDRNNGRIQGRAGYTSHVNQTQTHRYETERYNPANDSYQYSTGSVTTGTGSPIIP